MTKRKSISYLIESEMEKATILLAAKAIADKLQQMAEQIAKMDANDVMPLGDSMRELFGAEQANAFEKAVSEKLRGLTEQVRDAKNSISDQIDSLESGTPMNDLGGADDDNMFADDADGAVPAPEGSAGAGHDDAHEGDHAELAHPAAHEDGAPDMSDLDDVFADADTTGHAGRPQKESARSTKKMLEGVSADHRLAREFTSLIREGYTVDSVLDYLGETYLMDRTMTAKIVQQVISDQNKSR